MQSASREVLSAVGTVLLVVGTVSCQGQPPLASLEPEDITSLRQADRIISTEVTPVENALLINAHGAVVEACMQRLGWDFEVPAATPEEASGGPAYLTLLEQWTFVDAPSAEAEGYGFEAYLAEVAAYLAQVGELDREARIPDPTSMSPEDAARYELDYFGTEEERVEIVERDGSTSSVAGGGCLGEASRAVWGDIEQELRLRDARGTAEADIWGATLADDAVSDTLNAWRSCVRQEGLEFEDPPHAVAAALTSAQAGDFDSENLIAEADATCKIESGLDGAVQTAFLTAANVVLPELEDDLLALQQFEAAALERAKDILRFGE
jgi:hypothetical protein